MGAEDPHNPFAAKGVFDAASREQRGSTASSPIIVAVTTTRLLSSIQGWMETIGFRMDSAATDMTE